MRFSDIKNHLGKFSVGIAGTGGLGSNCAVALARSGIGKLIIADFDIVEPMNLTRQYYFRDQTGMHKTAALKETINRIDNDIKVVAHQLKLDRENIPNVFKDCDIIVEAFDSNKMKEMLIETVQIKMPGIPLIIGSGLAGWGNNETIKCRKIDDTLYVCGDESTETDAELPPLAPRVGIVANMQANMVIEILMKKTRDYFQV